MKQQTEHLGEPQFARCSTTQTNTRPIFTHDSKYLVCAAGQTVRFYGVLSGEVVYEVKVHTDLITHIVVAPHNPRQLVSCGLDGRLAFIDSSDAQVLRVLQWRSPLYGVYFCSSKSQSKLRLILLSLHKRVKESALSGPESSVDPGSKGPVADDLGTASEYRKCVNEDAARTRTDCALHLFELDAERNELTQLSERPLFADVSRDATRTGVDIRGNFLVTLRLRKMMVCAFKDGEGQAGETTDSFIYHAPIVHRAHDRIEFECLALHPTQTGCVVTGLSDGRMVIWWNVAERQADSKDVKLASHSASSGKKGGVKLLPRQKAKTTTLHWHALPVGALAYTPDGSFLLSGGLESVLVKWYQPETRRMDFLPRLGAPIRSLSVSPDASFYAVAHNDNAISLVQASVNGVIQSLYGLVGAHRFNRRLKAERFILPAGLHRDPVSSQLVLNGRIGLLQFYDPRADRCTMQLDVVGENLISPENIDNAEAQTWLTEVVCLAFSPRGNWLVTAESLVRSLMRYKDDQHVEDSAYSEVRLKFWRLRPDRSNFELATCVDMPHVGDVQVLQFGSSASQFDHQADPDDSCLTLASCGAQDGRVRLWKLARDANATDASWQCVASAAYRETQCVSACDFSADASLLAAVFDGDVTLFRTDPRFGYLELLAALDSGSEPAKSVHMLNRTWSHLLVSYATTLRLFDVLDCSCLWNYDLTVSNPNEISLCVLDKMANRFAVIDRQNVVTAFDCDSKTPLFRHSIPQSITNKQPLHAVFDNVGDPNLIRIYFATLDCTVCTIEHRLNGENAPSQADTSMAVDHVTTRHEDTTQQESSKAKTPFELFVASYKRSADSDRLDALRERGFSTAGERDYDAVIAQFVASPSHTLPNAAVMCHSLFTAALRLRPAESS